MESSDPNGCVWVVEWWNNDEDGWHTMASCLYQIETGLENLKKCGGVTMHWRIRNIVTEEVIPQELLA